MALAAVAAAATLLASPAWAWTSADLRAATHPSTPLLQPIAPSARVDPDSPAMIAALAEVARTRGFVVSVSQWTVPVYGADATTPLAMVTVLGRPPGANLDPSFVHNRVTTMSIPIPAQAQADDSTDAHMTIVDPGRRCQYDFYGASKANGRWQAAWVNRMSLPSSGIYPYGLSNRASGFAALAGAIWPDELRAGAIEHALVFNYPHTRAGGPVWPATASDGVTPGRAAIPEGARVRLDPSLDLSTLSLTTTERTIATALQKYGMYLVDTGGAVGIYAVSAQSFAPGAYAGLLDTPGGSHETYLRGIPTSRLQVMQLGPQIPVTPLKVLAPPGC